MPAVLVWGHCGTWGSATSLSVRYGQSSCGLLALPLEDLSQVPEWCTGIPVLVHWTAIAVFHMAAVGFAFAIVCVCVKGTVMVLFKL